MYNSPVQSRVFRSSVLSLLVFFCSVAAAQNASKAKLSYKLLSIHVKGLNHFKEPDIITASGLKVGQFAGEAEFKHAVDKLGETGLFSNLTYAYQYSTAGCNLDLQVEENEKLAPVLFDNFVWFADDELIAMLHVRLPLFEGRLAVGGSLGDQVAQALNSILAERKISGETEYVPFGPRDGSVESFIYKVNFHPVLVRKIEFPGAAAAEMPALEAAAHPLAGQDYLRSRMRIQQRLNFLPVYRSRGYLKARFSDTQARIASDGEETQVDVTSPVEPGVQYKLIGIQWAGNSVLPADRLQSLIQLKSGEPADAVRLESDIEQVKKLYGTKGYLFTEVEAAAAMDDAQATVSYSLNVTEGDLYRMGKLELDGLDPQVAKKMEAQWQMKPGDPFDDSYLARFFKTMYRDVGLRVALNVVPKQTVDRESKTVSITLHFMPKS